VVWSPGYDLGTAQAEETRNPGSGTGPFVLFQSDSRTESAPGLQGKFGVYLARSVSVEAGVLVSRPDLSARLTGDAESAPEITATETLNRFVVDGRCCSMTGHRLRRQGDSISLGGAGYLRTRTRRMRWRTRATIPLRGGLHYWFGQGRIASACADFNFEAYGGADATDTTRTVPTHRGIDRTFYRGRRFANSKLALASSRQNLSAASRCER
jgi:hypothetical protein